MPQAVTAAGSTNIVAHSHSGPELAAVGKITDAKIDKLDKNRDGTITEKELGSLKRQIDRANKRAENQDSDIDLRNPDKAEVRRQLVKMRKSMTEGDRTAMLVAMGAGQLENALTLTPTALKEATRKATADMVTAFTSDAGGLEGALGKMMAMMFLPKSVIESIMGPLEPRASHPGSGDAFVR